MWLKLPQRKNVGDPAPRWCRNWLSLGLVLMLPAAGIEAAADGWQVDGENGVIQVSGQLTEGACRLDMRSAMQQIELGNSDTRPLKRAGDRGTPVQINIFLSDCQQHDEANKGDSGQGLQPTISVTFEGEADSNNPQLLAVKGTSGMGLRLLDANKKDLSLGISSGSALPTYLTPDSSQLIYYVVPERTSVQLIAGAWQAVVNFRLSYE